MSKDEVTLTGMMKTKGKMLKYWKKTHVRLIRGSNVWNHRLEYDSNSHIIYLYKVKDIKMHANRLTLFFHGGAKKYFAAQTDCEASQWCMEIRELLDEIDSKQELFSVKPRRNAVMTDHSPVMLKVTHDSIIIIHPDNNQTEWNFQVIRRYGYSWNLFHFESGSSAETGAKEFFFESREAKRIYKKVHTSVQNMAKSL